MVTGDYMAALDIIVYVSRDVAKAMEVVQRYQNYDKGKYCFKCHFLDHRDDNYVPI